MSRGLFTTAVFLALAAWAGAQGPPPVLSAADHLGLLRANQGLLDDLVEHGVQLADADTPLKRADAAHAAARRLGRELTAAVGAADADRVAEMGEHLDALLQDGLVPTIKDARAQIPPASDEAKRLRKLYDDVLRELDDARGTVPDAGAVGDNGKVKSARGQLAKTRAELGAIGTDW